MDKTPGSSRILTFPDKYTYLHFLLKDISNANDLSKYIFIKRLGYGEHVFKHNYLEIVQLDLLGKHLKINPGSKWRYIHFQIHLPPSFDHGGYIFWYINPGKVPLNFSENMLNLLLEYNEKIFIWLTVTVVPQNMIFRGSFWNSLCKFFLYNTFS